MRKIFIIHIFSLICIVFTSCNSEKKDLPFAPPRFQDTIKLQGRVVTDSYVMGLGYDIDCYNNTLIVSAFIGEEEERIHLFNTSDGSHIKSILPKGRGPAETFVATEFDVDKENGNVIFYDFMTHRLLSFNIDSIVKYPDHTKYIQSRFQPVYMYAVYQGNEGYIAKGGKTLADGKNPRFSIIRQDSAIFKYCTYPDVSVPEVEGGVELGYIAYCNVDISPDKNKLVCTSTYGSILEIFDIEKDSIVLQTIRGFQRPYFTLDKYLQVRSIPHKTIHGFIDQCLTNDYIYTLYNDIPDDNTSLNINFRHIAVFDWQGNEVCLYQSDYDLKKICVDEETNKLYAIAKNDQHETILVEFQLP